MVVPFDDDPAICDNWINNHPSQLFSGFSLYMGALYGRGDGDERKGSYLKFYVQDMFIP